MAKEVSELRIEGKNINVAPKNVIYQLLLPVKYHERIFLTLCRLTSSGEVFVSCLNLPFSFPSTGCIAPCD